MSTRHTDCHVPSSSRPAITGSVACGGTRAGEYVVAAVAGAAVAVLPAVVGGEQGVQGGEEVVVAARAGFEDRDPRCRVRYEDVEQPVPAAWPRG